MIFVSVASAVQQFNMENINLLLESSYQVDVACNMQHGSNFFEKQIADMKKQLEIIGISVYDIPIPRKIGAIKDILYSYSIAQHLFESKKYDLIHCHTPIAAVIARLAARRSRKNGTKVIYTAHGFHFYKGAPLLNWLLYYPIEKLCAHFTDVLVTINNEDYAFAKRKLKVNQIEYIPGIGVDTKKFSDCAVDRAEKRKELGIPENATLLVSVGELNRNKNHAVVIKALAKLNNTNIYYLIAGKGNLEGYLNDLIKNLNLENNIRLLSYRTDIAELYKAADICVFPSIREGLGLAAIEGMAAGLPLIVADNRGTRDFCTNNVNGLVCNPFSPAEFANAISTLNANPKLCEKYGNINKSKAADFDISIINKIMNEIYSCSDKKG